MVYRELFLACRSDWLRSQCLSRGRALLLYRLSRDFRLEHRLLGGLRWVSAVFVLFSLQLVLDIGHPNWMAHAIRGIDPHSYPTLYTSIDIDRWPWEYLPATRKPGICLDIMVQEFGRINP